MSTKLEVKNVSYEYSPNTPFAASALTDVSCAFEAGMITGLIGHTGSGKSTLVQMLNGLLRPVSGQILLDGRDIWENPKQLSRVRYRVGLVFQYPEYQLFEETVSADIAYGPKNMGLDGAEIDARVREAAEFVGLEADLLDKSPFELSGGQKRRVAIAGILAMRPEVLVLDEPAAGLDPIGRETIFDAVRAYQQAREATVIIVSHSMEDMAKYAERLVVMSESRVILAGTPDEIFRRADLLCSIGLDVPQITRTMMRLSELGLPCRTDIFTIEAAKEEILRLWGKERENA